MDPVKDFPFTDEITEIDFNPTNFYTKPDIPNQCKSTSTSTYTLTNHYTAGNTENMAVIRLMKDLSGALNGRGKTVDRLQIHLQELLIKLQMEEEDLLSRHEKDIE